MAKYHTAVDAINQGKKVRRALWEPCKTIRKSQDSDHDFFYNEVDLEGKIIEDCKKHCDCQIGLWISTEEDKEADDWIILS